MKVTRRENGGSTYLICYQHLPLKIGVWEEGLLQGQRKDNLLQATFQGTG